MKKLYCFANCGCDDTTIRYMWLSDVELRMATMFIKELNKGSTYGCQPTIEIYTLSEGTSFEDMFTDEPPKTEEEENIYGSIAIGDKIYYAKDPWYFYGTFLRRLDI